MGLTIEEFHFNVQAGEELTVSYLPDNFIADRETRRKFLMKNHNFLCQCSICSLEGPDLENDEKWKIIARRRVGKCLCLEIFDIWIP